MTKINETDEKELRAVAWRLANKRNLDQTIRKWKLANGGGPVPVKTRVTLMRIAYNKTVAENGPNPSEANLGSVVKGVVNPLVKITTKLLIQLVLAMLQNKLGNGGPMSNKIYSPLISLWKGVKELATALAIGLGVAAAGAVADYLSSPEVGQQIKDAVPFGSALIIGALSALARIIRNYRKQHKPD
jgi:hypothetical protein